jgi:hypothetical protein
METLTPSHVAYLEIQDPDALTPQQCLPLLWIQPAPSGLAARIFAAQEHSGAGLATCTWEPPAGPAQHVRLLVHLSVPGQPPCELALVFDPLQQHALVRTLATSPAFGLLTQPWPLWQEFQPAGEASLVLTPDLLPLLRHGLLLPAPDPRPLSPFLPL